MCSPLGMYLDLPVACSHTDFIICYRLFSGLPEHLRGNLGLGLLDVNVYRKHNRIRSTCGAHLPTFCSRVSAKLSDSLKLSDRRP